MTASKVAAAIAEDPRPRIVVSTTDQASVVDQAEQALILAGGVYVRARTLVHVVRDRGADWLTRPDGMPVIEAVANARLRELLGESADWVTIAADGEGKRSTRSVTVPAWIPVTLMARGEWLLPQIEGVVEAPVFRIDGSILDEPGYDPATRLIYDPCGVTFPAVPKAPTRADASRALDELLEPFNDFPFVEACDRSAVAALILSMIGRGAIDGCVPMFASRAPTPGSGKGLLVEAAAIIATGREAPTMAPSTDDNETRKRLLAIALESPTIVLIDNVEGAIGSPSLAMALTTGAVHERELGATKMVTASLRSVWCLTGNNVQMRGDLGRRVVPIDIDPRLENPEDRDGFRHPCLLGYVRAERPRLVAAALTVLRGYHVGGRPAHGFARKGSFEAWDDLVRGAVIWAGGPDPLGGVQRIRNQGDDDLERLSALLVTWREVFDGRAMTIAEAIKRAGDAGELHDALAAYCRAGKPDSKQLGYAFRKVANRISAGMEMRGEVGRCGVKRWRVVVMVATVGTVLAENGSDSDCSIGVPAETSHPSPSSPPSGLACQLPEFGRS